MAPNPSAEAVSRQFEVLKTTSTTLGRMIETHASEALGRKVRVTFETTPGARKTADVSIVLIDMKQGLDNHRREYERNGDEEQFRSPPVVFEARYLVSAWAKPPEDQSVLGAVMRTFLDHPQLEWDESDEDIVAYAGTPTPELRFLQLEEHNLLASAHNMPMAPSVTYTLSLRLRSGKVSKISRVRERVIDFRNITS